MSGRRDSSHFEPYNVRWHSVADMSTPRVDIMSSPDPLNDADADSTIQVPSSRRVTRSQRSERFVSLGSSPRKQTFALQVGDNNSPQKLFVTVETDDGNAASDPRRKLFQQSATPPSTRHRVRATTTTVPLRESIEEESADALVADPLATPKRRGRPRKSNGTPMPSAGTKRRAATPIKRTPRRPRTAKAADTDDAQSEASVQPTPKSSKRGRPRKQVVPPSSELGAESVQTTTSTKGRRRRRQAIIPDEFLEMADEAAENASIYGSVAASENDVDLIRAPSEPFMDEIVVDPTPPPEDTEPEQDLWMATLSDQATPRAVRQTVPVLQPEGDNVSQPEEGRSSPPPDFPQQDLEPSDLAQPDFDEQDLENAETSQAGDYGYLAPAASDVSSADEPPAESVPQTNDTIAQGEDFSMIFMDSIPSLQADFSSSIPAATHNDFGDETNLIINNTLESLRQSTMQDHEQEAEPEQPEPLIHVPETVETVEREVVSAGAASTLSPSRHLSPRLSRSPRKLNSSPLRRQVLKLNARQAENAANDDFDNEQEQTPRAFSGRRLSERFNEADESNMYEDSFSEIPQDILEAATPKQPSGATFDDDMVDEDDEVDVVQAPEMEMEMEAELTQQPEMPAMEQVTYESEEHSEEEEEQGFEEQAAPSNASASNASAIARSDGGRLPTPDDTPPHNETDEVDDQEKSTQASHVSYASQASLASSGIASPARSSSQADAAPEIVPRISEPPQQPTLSVPWPVLPMEVTPINQMSSPVQDPQSLMPEPVLERSRRPTLSPIVRAGRALQSVTSDPPSPEGRERQLGSPFRSSASKESWPGAKEHQNNQRISMSPQRPLRSSQAPSVPANRLSEDPFGASSRNIGQTGFMQALNRSMNGATGTDRPASRGSAASSMRITPSGDDEMSWIANEGPISPNLRGDNSLKDVSGSSTRRALRGSLSVGQVDGTVDELGAPAGQDDETDIWEFEASREIPPSTRQQPFGKKAAAPVHRRGTIPSPWTKKPTQAPIEPVTITGRSNEQPKAPQPAKAVVPEADEAYDYSMLNQGQRVEEETAPETATKPERFNLSSFFSSPAAIPGMLAGKLFASKTKPTQELGSNQPEPVQTAFAMPTSSMFPQIPQKEFRPQASPQKALFSPARPRQAEKQQSMVGSSSPATPERLEMPTVAQKKNFTPRPRQTSQTFFQPSSAIATAQTPPRMQLSHADIKKWQHETSTVSEAAPVVGRALLRPLPPKNASPTKSSLRSPMKAHTPGRVVEFTSSVLSPVEQAKARHQRRMSINDSTFQAPSFIQAPTAPEMDDKENHDASDISMSDAPPLEKLTQPELLSQTAWTRQHWLLLDELLQLRRQAPFDLDYERRSDKYLGKTVKSQGEAMRLDRWHLDCVDAFKAEVGGWDEGVLAKRLFALILGEERRGLGTVEKPARVMFH